MPQMLSRILEPGYLAKTGALAVCYFVAATASLLLAIPPGYATAVWPPSGIALAALLLFGARVWPGVWLGALLANFAINHSPGLAVAIASGNTLEALLAAWLAQRFLDAAREFLRAESVFRFALIAAISSCVAATVGVVALYLSGRIEPGELHGNWYTWWQGDLSGIIVVAPFLLAWLSGEERRGMHSRPSEVVAFGVLFSLAFTAVFALGWWVGTDIARSLIFLLIPFMAWAGLRFDQRTVTATIVAVTGVAVLATINNRSPFQFFTRNEALLTLQAFITTVALMGLVLCALTRQRRDAIATLQHGSNQLEAMVADRTRDLADKNEDLARDIAEKERLALALQAREAQLAEAQAITHVGSWDWDVQADRVTWSAELFRIYGISPEEFGGTVADYLSRVHPDDRERVSQAVEHALKEREPWELTERILRPDGTVRVLKTLGKVLTDAQGNIASMYGACLDVTRATRVEQVQAVQIRVTTALLDASSSEEAIVSAMRSICEGLGWVVAQTWQVDPGAESMRPAFSWPPDSSAATFVAESRPLSLKRGEGLPGRCWQRETVVWIEDVAADPTFLRVHSARREGLHGAFAFPLIAGNQVLGVMECFNKAAQRPDTELVHMLTSVGNHLGEYIVRNRSQSLLRQSEQRFRVLVQGVKEYAIFMLDPDGCVSTWNTGAERIKGYRADEIIGVHYSRFFPPEDLADNKPARELTAATRQGQFEGEGWRIRKDGSRFWANTVITALHDENGRLRGFAKVTRDMSDRKRLEALEEAGRQTRQFLAMLAHELRNPLAPIRNAVSVMRIREPGDEQLRACRDIIERQVEHLSRLVDDLFDVSRITSGKVALQKRPIDVASAVSRAAECVRPFIDARQQMLEIDVPKEPIAVHGDLTRLAQIVQNLLHNSAKYTPPGGRIVLTLRRESDTAVIRVRDNGVGIATHLLSKVFDLFMQAERPVDCSDGGLGIGLTLVRQLVELHGGSVAASSEGPGRGAEFTVRLPCLRSSIPAPALPDHTVVATGVPSASGLPRILVVDDNRDSAESMALLLRLSGHQTWLAFDGHSAVSLAAEHSPDAVLLDIGLPGMDGYQVASKLRELPQTSDSLLIALTGHGQEEDRQRSKAAGFSEHFVKPVDVESLFRAIARHQRARPGGQRP